MALSPRAKQRYEADKQLGCFPRSGVKLPSTPGNTRERTDGNPLKTSRDAFEEKEKELREIRNYWQEEYKSKVSEVANLEAALKESVESRNNEVEELTASYESALRLQNSEISQLRETLDELMGTKEEILASAEKSIGSKLRAKDAELLRLRVWLEEAKKSNSQGREVLTSYQKRLREKEMEIEELKMSCKEEIELRDKEVERLKALLSEVIAEKDQDTENTKFTLNSVVEEKERQMEMLKESSDNALALKNEENKRKEKDIKRLKGELAGKETEIEQLQKTIENLQNLISVTEDEKSKLIAALRTASETRRDEMAELQERQQTLLDDKDNQLMSLQMLSKEQQKHHEIALRDKDRRIEELSTRLGCIESQLVTELSEKGHNEDLKTKIPSILTKMSDLKEEKVVLEKDVEGLLRDVHAKETKLNDIRKTFESESQEKQVLKQKCDSLAHDLDNWKSAMKLIEEERNSLENEVKRLGDELESKSSTCCEFEYKVQSLESVQKNLEDVIAQLRKENTDLFQGQKNLEFVIRERDREQNLLKEKLSISENKFALEIERTAMKEENNTATLENLRSKYKETRRENGELKANLDEREKDVASLSSLLENAQQQEHKLEVELDQLSEELEVLNEKYIRGNDEKEALERSLTNAVTLKQQELEEMQKNFEKSNSDLKNEMEKREDCWNEALKAKDDLLRDGKRSFDERVVWKEDEIRQLEKSLEETKMEFQSVRESLEKSLNLKEKAIDLLQRKFNDSLTAKEASIEEITARNEDVLCKREEIQKELEECKVNLDRVTEMARQQDCFITLTKEKIAQLEANLEEKEELLQNAEKQLVDLQSRLKEEEENYVTEIKDVIQSAEVGFKERENVAEKLKAMIQGNAVKYRLALQKKDDKITVLKNRLENSDKDAEDLRVNLATLIQESGDNEEKLRNDLNKLEDERAYLEEKITQLTENLEKRVEEVNLLEDNMTTVVSDLKKQLKIKDEEKEKLLEELDNERVKVRKLEEGYSLLKLEMERKESLERQLEETSSNLSKLRDNFNQAESLLKMAENEKLCVEEVKQDLLQELEAQKRLCNAKDDKMDLMLQKIKMLRKTHFEAAQKQEKLEENVVTLQIKLNEKDAETRELRKESDNKQEELYQRSVLLEEMELKKDDLEKQITTLESEVNTQKAEIKEATEKENELKRAVQELLERLKENELNTTALVSNVKDEKAENEKLCSEYQNFKASALKEQDRMHDELDHLHSELEKDEGLLLILNKEKEGLLTELGKWRQSEENTKANLDCHIQSLMREKENLLTKLASLDKETKQRFAEISELYSALKSAEVSKECLAHELESLKASALAKETSLCEARRSLETARKENSRLKCDIKGLEANLNREVKEKNDLVESFEELKNSTSQMKEKMENVLLEKENVISNSESFLHQMKEENESLRKRLSKCEGELRADKKCVVALLEKRRAMTAQIDSLCKDKEILNASLKDMDLFPVKLKTTEGKQMLEISFNENKQIILQCKLKKRISRGFYSFAWLEVSSV